MSNLFHTTLSANGSAPSTDGQAYPGPKVAVTVSGTFGSGTATIQTQADDDTNWVDVETGYTAATVKEVTLGEGMKYRVTLTGSTSPSLVVTSSLVQS